MTYKVTTSITHHHLDQVLNIMETNNIQNVTGEYKATAAKVLRELEKTLGKDLDDKEKFMFVHGTAECKLPDKSDGPFQGRVFIRIID